MKLANKQRLFLDAQQMLAIIVAERNYSAKGILCITLSQSSELLMI
jgi:hypothetical protein